jgi:glycosyltransferase involved in cell wall biosynthesis
MRDKIAVITNAANVRKIEVPAVQLRSALGIPQESLVCGFIGSFHYWHDAKALLSIAEKLLIKHPNLSFIFIGQGGASAADIRKEFSEQPWSERGVFIDHVQHHQIQNYINIFDIALAPYARQPLFYYSPVKIFEYMAYGIALVTVPLGQIKEIVQDRENGLFYDPDKENDLAEKIKELVNNPEMRIRLGARAKELIASTHTWDQKARELEALCLSASTETHLPKK